MKYKFSLLAFLICTNVAVASTPKTTLIPGTFSAEYEVVTRIEGYSDSKPPAEVLKKILVPLSEADIPFDISIISNNFHPAGVYASKDWQLITLHRLPYSTFGGKQPFFSESKFSSIPFSVPGIGEFLFALGHPELPTLEAQGIPFRDAINKIKIEERPDLALIKNPSNFKLFPKIATSVSVGDEVFIVHQPFLAWLPSNEHQEFHQKAPFVSHAFVQKVVGRVAIVDANTFNGSSGGTVLNSQGAIVGVLSFSLKTKNTPPVTGAMMLDDQMIKIIQSL